MVRVRKLGKQARTTVKFRAVDQSSQPRNVSLNDGVCGLHPVPEGTQGLSLWFARLDADIQNVASAEDNVAIVCCWRIAPVLSCSVEDYVHVAVRVNHPASIFHIILQANANLCVQFLHEKVKGFSRWLQADHRNMAHVSLLR